VVESIRIVSAVSIVSAAWLIVILTESCTSFTRLCISKESASPENFFPDRQLIELIAAINRKTIRFFIMTEIQEAFGNYY
jgi:hypothetical protein